LSLSGSVNVQDVVDPVRVEHRLVERLGQGQEVAPVPLTRTRAGPPLAPSLWTTTASGTSASKKKIGNISPN
jgi:hypothetical protein